MIEALDGFNISEQPFSRDLEPDQELNLPKGVERFLSGRTPRIVLWGEEDAGSDRNLSRPAGLREIDPNVVLPPNRPYVIAPGQSPLWGWEDYAIVTRR